MKTAFVLFLMAFKCAVGWSVVGRWKPVDKIQHDPVFLITDDKIVCLTPKCTVKCRLHRTSECLELSEIHSSSGWPLRASLSDIQLFLEVRSMKSIRVYVVPEGESHMTAMWKFRGRTRWLKLEKAP